VEEARSIAVAKRREWTAEGLGPSIRWSKIENYGGTRRSCAELSIAWSKHSMPQVTRVSMVIYEVDGVWDYYVSWGGIEELPATGAEASAREARDAAVRALIKAINGKTVLAISNVRNQA